MDCQAIRGREMNDERKCTSCGWSGREGEIPGRDFHEDYGDVYLWYCPKCGQVDWDGELFEEEEQWEQPIS